MAVPALENLRLAYFLQLNLEVFETAAIEGIKVGRSPHGCLIEKTAALPTPEIFAHPRFGID